jgi:hypothetical protein
MCLAQFAALSLTALAAPPLMAAQQAAPGMADRIINNLYVEALSPYGLYLPPPFPADKGVQFGKALRIQLAGPTDFSRIGVTTPVLNPVRRGDRIVIASWARTDKTEGGAPGKIGRVELEAAR